LLSNCRRVHAHSLVPLYVYLIIRTYTVNDSLRVTIYIIERERERRLIKHHYLHNILVYHISTLNVMRTTRTRIEMSFIILSFAGRDYTKSLCSRFISIISARTRIYLYAQRYEVGEIAKCSATVFGRVKILQSPVEKPY